MAENVARRSRSVYRPARQEGGTQIALTPVALPAAANSSHYCGWRQREGLGMTFKQSRSRRLKTCCAKEMMHVATLKCDMKQRFGILVLGSLRQNESNLSGID
eukprot:scaffold83944_cov61-Cyclotella_meneghiniana.AAC.1